MISPTSHWGSQKCYKSQFVAETWVYHQVGIWVMWHWQTNRNSGQDLSLKKPYPILKLPCGWTLLVHRTSHMWHAHRLYGDFQHVKQHENVRGRSIKWGGRHNIICPYGDIWRLYFGGVQWTVDITSNMHWCQTQRKELPNYDDLHMWKLWSTWSFWSDRRFDVDVRAA